MALMGAAIARLRANTGAMARSVMGPNDGPQMPSPTRPSYLTSADFAELPRTGAIDPRVVRYSQDSAGDTFRPPYGSVDEFVQRLQTGQVDPASIKPIRIVEKDGNVYTLDNRRLYSFEKAEVNVPYQKLDAIPKRELFKFTTENQGTSIIIRRGQKNGG